MAESGFAGGIIRVIVGGALLSAIAAPAAGIECAGVIGAEKLAPFFERARTTRVDVVGIGDSNQVFGGHGWDHAWAKALSDEFGLYATGLISAGENAGNGGGVGYTWTGFSTAWTGALAYAGAPDSYDAFLAGSTPLHPGNYLYLAPGIATGAGFSTGIALTPGSPLGVNDWLRFHIAFGTHAGDGPGSFRPAVRLDQPPYSNLVIAAPVSTRGPDDSVSMTGLDLPPALRNSALAFRFVPQGIDLVGPCIIYWSRVERPDRQTGASFHTLMGLGGASARRMALGVQTASDAQLSLFFSLVRAEQAEPRAVLIRINTGLNDRNETLPSLGPVAITDGDSPEAFTDNLRAIMHRIETIWTLNAWPSDELYFLLSVSHPVAEPDDPELAAYRDAAAALAGEKERCAATRFDRLTSESEMIANGWYQSAATDRNHLRQAGFEALAAREIEAIIPPACPGDADNDRNVDFGDVTSVLANWGLCAPLRGMGDADGDRGVNFADITAVLSWWESCSPRAPVQAR